jgi:hypothetical protein
VLVCHPNKLEPINLGLNKKLSIANNRQWIRLEVSVMDLAFRGERHHLLNVFNEKLIGARAAHRAKKLLKIELIIARVNAGKV